ncbi:unnamed protein product [Cyberlindnera jadinii]|uniref:Uncharacterized protein n=1 Tax=Cyberlindnera jadinii (strain ATCC 18201 / CBS 1600 / BCRC 20928 / JCM 3617 / NBRC 0987 / NRRL Y-1542) TaxID=983966 RepID=A0A0H5C991_CYBJN|nr:unnamed protein product [Cyberlindnera jadinii]
MQLGIFLLASIALAVKIQLSVDHPLKESEFTGISSDSGKGGLNYLFLREQSQTLDYNPETKQITTDEYGSTYTLQGVVNTNSFPFLALYPGDASSANEDATINWDIEDGVLIAHKPNGNEVQLYAAKDVGDPYGLSKDSYIFGATEADKLSEFAAVRGSHNLQVVKINVKTFEEPAKDVYVTKWCSA